MEVRQARPGPGVVGVPSSRVGAEREATRVFRNDEEAGFFGRHGESVAQEGEAGREEGRRRAAAVDPGGVGGSRENEDVQLALRARRVEQLEAEAAARPAIAVDVASKVQYVVFRESVEQGEGVGGFDVDVDVAFPRQEPRRRAARGAQQRPRAQRPLQPLGHLAERAQQLVVAPRRPRRRFQPSTRLFVVHQQHLSLSSRRLEMTQRRPGCGHADREKKETT
mmetsp:Transcript_25999/g.80007  ORF Transcript_25999/g.80007 Transcript_25999/m.80007 type:complete len:223 (+) Transcript_25999:677-1345(+)